MTKNGQYVDLVVISMLVTTHAADGLVPCYKRCKYMEAMEVKERIIDEGDDEGGWVETQFEQGGMHVVCFKF